MSGQKFARRDVDRAFRKFNDLNQDLMNATFQTWPHAFTHLVTHCEQNPVMRAVTDPLRANKNVDVHKWYTDALASVEGMIGTGQYKLPFDDDDRTALLYQFFLKIEQENIDIGPFCEAVYGATRYQDMASYLNQELVVKFAREVSYRLNEVTEDIGDATVVTAEAIRVFHYHDHSMNFHGNIQGSNVAVGGSTVADSTAAYTSGTEVADALKALKPLLHEVAEGQRGAIEAALQLLVKSAEGELTPTDQVEQAADTVAKASPTLRKRLGDIGGKISLSLASSTIFQGIKSALGIP